MNSFSGQGIVGFESLVRDIVSKMVTGGFKIIAVDGQATSAMSQTGTKFALEVTNTVDPNADTQPWCVLFEASDSNRRVNAFVLPKPQLTSTFEAPGVDVRTQAGRVSREGSIQHSFIHQLDTWGIEMGVDLSAIPMGYTAHFSDHGFALQVFVEGRDWSGRAFSWFCAQRGVTTPVGPTPGKDNPLFCVYSCGGGCNGNPDVLDPLGIERFTVSEPNVNAASKSVSAVQCTTDGVPIINPLQQVSLMKGNKAVVLFPQLINTQSHLYFLKLDMLGYTSADVISMSSEVTLMPSDQKIVFQAGCANGQNNRGMRIMFPVRPYVE